MYAALIKTVRTQAPAGAALLLAATAVSAQAAPAPPAPLAIPAPNYVTIVQEIEVARPAAAVWARVGKYCDISEWFGLACAITEGKDGQLGVVRVLNGATIELMVARTDLSYTYSQPVRIGQPYNQYHGTLEAKAVSPTTSKLVYSLIFDNSMLLDEPARARDKEQRTTRFAGALKNMKTLAEGGTLPPPAAPAVPR